MNELAGLPAEIGRYRVVGLLGRGGMGRVVRARDPQLQREVAIKLVETGALDDEREARFMFHREARAVARLKHPGVIEIYDYSGPEAELPYIACELIEAPTLRDVLETRGVTLPPATATALVHEVAQALEHAHAQGIVHRDIKPENIFWLPSGRIVLADFGIAKALGDARFAGTVQYGATNLYGSPSYMAPEQVRGETVDVRTDLHALGAVLYEMLCGAPPYVGETVEELLSRVETGAHESVPADVGPTQLVQLIDQLLARSPGARPQNARIVADRLRRVLDALDVRDPRSVLADTGEISRTVVHAVVGEDTAKTHVRSPAPKKRSEERPLNATRLVPTPRARGPQNWLLVACGVALIVVAGLTAWLSVKPSGSAKPVNVVIVLPGPADLTVDGAPQGPVHDIQRMQLTPGRHVLEARVYEGGRTLKREIYVVSGSGEAQFEL